MFQNCPKYPKKKNCWKGLYGLHKIYRETTKKYIKNILNQNCLKFKSTYIACPMLLYAQAFKTSEVCPIFWTSLFCTVKNKETCAQAGTYAKRSARTINCTCKVLLQVIVFLKSWSFRAPLNINLLAALWMYCMLDS